MEKVSNEILEKRFSEFVLFVKAIENEYFTSFATSGYLIKQENYKNEVSKDAKDKLQSKFWKIDDVGTGKIQKAANSAMQTEVVYNGKVAKNNLIDWRKKDDFKNLPLNKDLETILFEFYKNKLSDADVFEKLLEQKLSYQTIAYIFFIKDCEKYLPISQERFDEIFEIIGIGNFKTRGNASWDNYLSFNGIIKQVQVFLKTKDSQASLLDAHSFLFILGSQMKAYAFPLEVIKNELDENAIPIKDEYISEEDDEVVFPEGKEKYVLHRKKERNSNLPKAVKEKRLKIDPKLCCEACGFSFVEKYGKDGEGFIEAHHIFPISQLTEKTEVTIDDIALVCSNCHRMLHRARPWKTVEELKTFFTPK